MKRNFWLLVAGALCWALANGASASTMDIANDGWPQQPKPAGVPFQSFRGPFPPYGAGSVFTKGGYWFLNVRALEIFHKDRGLLMELIKKKEITEISPGTKITLLETFDDFEGRANVEGFGNGYILLHDWF